ncbi:MAG: adenylate/guanylate cyclase domain-containing protein [Gemmatimonadota bacterium]
MLRSDFFRPTFRVKLLLALFGTVAPLLLVTLLVVRREANRQVDAVVASTVNRAGDAFARIERIRQQQLAQLGQRAANSNRWGAALQEALDGDTDLLIEATRYELGLAGFPDALAAFTSLGADPIAAVVRGGAVANPSSAISTPAIDRLFAGDTAVFGYHIIDRQLFSIHPAVLYTVDQPVGILLLGFAIDDETARTLGQALGVDVCFAANGQCVASSGVVQRARQVARVTHPLPGAAATAMRIVLGIPLDDVVRPFEKIQTAIRYIGLAVLALAILVAFVLSRGFAQPVRALVAATARVARGDYETQVRVRTNDEIGMLADAFNEMTRGLLLKEKYRGVLDKVISRDVADEMLKGEIKLGGETREVTTLFADIRNFTALSEGMPPHEVVALLNEVMERAEAAVVAEGGVVDKYVGDEIMALFGAPMSHGDDAVRAVRAAVRIQNEIAAMNARRAAGAAPITVGIGINTGIVVAGNMGSARRLNYTVLGAPVNLASRLCGDARGGQILLSSSTRERVSGQVHVAALGARVMKGISRPLEIFEVIALEEDSVAATSARATLALIASLLLAPATMFAQRTWTLGSVQLQPSARIDLQAFAADASPSWLIADTTAFLAGRASGFLDIFAGRHLYGLFELRLDHGETPGRGDLDLRIEQAFARITPLASADASAQLGRFVSPFGNYPQRHHSGADPLIRPPLSYDYRTMVTSGLPPSDNNDFIDWKDAPQTMFRRRGAPPVWAAPYQLGVMLVGSAGPASYRLAAMNGAPSAEPDVWNRWPKSVNRLSYVAHMGVQVMPELRLGASYNYGPYLHPDADTINFRAGKSSSDYHQRLIGIEATLTRGLIELRGELIHDTWEVPRVSEKAIDISWYAEGKLKLGPGLFAAGRYSSIHFNELHYKDGSTSPWDFDARRIQLGAGYRVSESFDVRSELMLNSSDGPTDPDDNLFSIQATWLIR